MVRCTLEQDVVRLVIMTVMNENAGAEPGCLSYFYFVDYLELRILRPQLHVMIWVDDDDDGYF